MWILLAVGVLSLGISDVNVATLDGEEATGKLVALSPDQLVVESDGRQTTVAVADLLSLVPRQAPSYSDPRPSVWIELVDGSRIQAAGYEAAAGNEAATRNAVVELLGGGHVVVPTRSIHSVLLKSQAMKPALEKQWKDAQAAKRTSDTIVLRKEGANKAFVLDSLDGVLHGVTAEAVVFTFSGREIPVKREKIEGLIYYHPAGRELPAPICQLTDADDSVWMVRTLQLDGDRLQLTTTAGVEFELPLARLRGADFSVGKIVFLSDLEPASVEWSSYFASRDNATRLADLYQPRRDRSFDGGMLELTTSDGSIKRYTKGLALHSRSELNYRLPDEFRRLLAQVAIDRSVRPGGNVQLVVSGDGRVLLDTTVTGRDEQPLNLDLDITGVRRLRILVDFGGDLDIADYVNLCGIKVTK